MLVSVPLVADYAQFGFRPETMHKVFHVLLGEITRTARIEHPPGKVNLMMVGASSNLEKPSHGIMKRLPAAVCAAMERAANVERKEI